MKKILAVFLLLALFAPATSLGESSSGLHLLWGIPFSTTADDFAAQAAAASGLDFSINKRQDGSVVNVSTQAEASFALGGLDAENVSAIYSPQGRLLSINIRWVVDQAAPPDQNAAIFAELFAQLEQQYGPAEKAGLFLSSAPACDTLCDIERTRHPFSTDTIRSAQAEKFEKISATAQIGNVFLSYSCELVNGKYANHSLFQKYSNSTVSPLNLSFN